jgi:hypothetical protein
VKLPHVDNVLDPDERDDHAFESNQAPQVIHLSPTMTLTRDHCGFKNVETYLKKLVRTIGGAAVAIIVQDGVSNEEEGIAYGHHVERSAPEIFRGQVKLNVSFTAGHLVPVFQVLIGKLI